MTRCSNFGNRISAVFLGFLCNLPNCRHCSHLPPPMTPLMPSALPVLELTTSDNPCLSAQKGTSQKDLLLGTTSLAVLNDAWPGERIYCLFPWYDIRLPLKEILVYTKMILILIHWYSGRPFGRRWLCCFPNFLLFKTSYGTSVEDKVHVDDGQGGATCEWWQTKNFNQWFVGIYVLTGVLGVKNSEPAKCVPEVLMAFI